MLDLDAILETTIDVKLEGKVIHVLPPSLKTMKGFLGAKDDDEKVIELLTVILNKNKENMEFSKDYLEELPQNVLVALIKYIAEEVKGISENPN